MITWLACAVYLVAVVDARLSYSEFQPMQPSAQELSKSMDNQHLVIVGDSLLRYQYLSLVYLIHNGTFYPNDERPNMVLEHSFSGAKQWLDFFEFGNRLFYPHEHCDCFRTASPLAPPKGSDVYENRYYRNEARNISITFLQYFGDGSWFTGHWKPADSNGTAPYKAPDPKYMKPSWKYTKVEDLLKNIASKLEPRPTALLINAGAHGNNYMSAAHRNSVFGTAKSLFERVIWKTSSPRMDRSVVGTADAVVCAHPGIECLNLNWTAHLTPADYTDKLHFFSRGYTNIDIQLITQLITKQKVVYSLMDTVYKGSIVQVEHSNGTVAAPMHFLVDAEGLLRRINSTSTHHMFNATCAAAKKQRAHHTLTRVDVLKHLVGDPIDDICTML